MDGDFVQIGRIINTHGNKGEIKVYPLTDFPERFRSLRVIEVETSSEEKEFVIESVRFHKGYVIMQLEGCHTISEAEALKGGVINIPEEELWPLGKDEYYYFQVIGLDVYTEEGFHLGRVEDIISTGSNDVYTVRKGRKEYLIPAIKQVVKEINLECRRVTIHPLEGLLDLSDAL